MSNAAFIKELDQQYRRYCESRDGRKGWEREEYLTDRSFAEREVGDFIDWLEEELTGRRLQPDTVVRYHRWPGRPTTGRVKVKGRIFIEANADGPLEE